MSVARHFTRREFLTRTGAVSGLAAAALAGPVDATALPARNAPHRPLRAPEEFDASVATAWFDMAQMLVRDTPGFSPPVASRAFAYTGIALYEAVVAGSARYRSLAAILPGLPNPSSFSTGTASWPVVANAALADMLRSLFPTASASGSAAIDSLEDSISDRWRRRLDRAVYITSVRRGRRVARGIFTWSTSDGGHEGFARNFPPDFEPPSGPGLWAPTPPTFQRALQPYWGGNRCFVIESGAACPPGSPTPYSADPASAFHAEANEVYEAVNHHTPEHEAIARFWSDDPGVTATPPGHSISIATQIIRHEDVSLMRAAEVYAKIGMAVADAFIACWHAKYEHNLLRPVTYIRAHIDPQWLPLLDTPPFPEFPSGHSVQSGAAFEVLSDLFGSDYAFTDHTHDGRGLAPRHFAAFAQAADEAAISRLYGGIHFRPAIDLGLAQGRCIGDVVNALPLRRRGRGR